MFRLLSTKVIIKRKWCLSFMLLKAKKRLTWPLFCFFSIESVDVKYKTSSLIPVFLSIVRGRLPADR